MAKNTGAFHIARQIFDSEIWTNKPATWNKIWIYILGKVKYNDTDRFKRGECFFNFSRERKDIGIDITEDMIKKCLTYLRKSEMIRTLRSTRGTVVKVMNYNHFQTLENYTSTTQSTREAREKHERSTPILKEVKKERKIYSETILQIVRDFYISKAKNHKTFNQEWEKNHKLVADSCDTIEKLNRIDGIPFDTIKAVVMRSIKDEFWQNQILSLRGLRTKSKNKEMKFTNAYASLMSDQYRMAAPEKLLIAYRYECPSCEKEYHPREFVEAEAWNCHRCTEPGCQKIGLAGGGNIGYELKYIEPIYKDIS